jgi:hypothetical protein
MPLGAGSSSVTFPVGLDCSVSFKAISPYQVHIPECKEALEQQSIPDTLLGYMVQEPTSIPFPEICSRGRDHTYEQNHPAMSRIYRPSTAFPISR